MRYVTKMKLIETSKKKITYVKNGIKIYYYVDLSLEKFNIEELKNDSLEEVYTDTKILFEKVIYENRTQNN